MVHAVCAVVALAALPWSDAAASPFDPPMQSLQVEDASRKYYLQRAASNEPRPLLIVIGGDRLPVYIMRKLGFELPASEKHISIAYLKAFDPGWGDGRDTDFGMNHEDIDDVAFIEELIHVLVHTGVADPRRIYIVGFSNGGILAYRALCNLPGKIAAVATVASSMSAESTKRCKPSGIVDILAINGTADAVVPWGGGEFRVPGSDGNYGSVMPVNDMVAFWRAHNRCGERVSSDTGNYRIQHMSWQKCNVQQYRLLGAGHGWPGAESPQLFAGKGGLPQPVAFNATQVIWEFLTGGQKEQ